MKRSATRTWAAIEVEAVMKNRRVIAGFFTSSEHHHAQEFFVVSGNCGQQSQPPCETAT